ncbi:dual specificity protein phosphatase family protein [Glaciihabitans sp. GrIS 2.15]|uniref:dual specificity protein phosphatase family protein n=1 Tax=Glaciihabitans sp. GrIS 2.15 TaxID=3071710 RepID=UPI002E06C983|nr:dual specificity phosphatase 3 [Glaciihabitans sp. GrIS 2.15]
MKTLKKANATQLTEQLWIGGELNPQDHTAAVAQLDELMAAGIDTIIDCRMECDDLDWATEAKPQLSYLSIGVEDAGYVMPHDWFDDGVTFALNEISKGGTVLVHCQAGINRGPSMGFLILITQGWDTIDALDLIHKRRPIARMAYAAQAIDWWMESTGAEDDEIIKEIRRIKKWRIDNKVPRSTEGNATWMGETLK